MKRVLIIKDKQTNIKVHSDYIDFIDKGFILSFKHIQEIYMYKNINLSLSDLVKVAKKAPLYLIDHQNNIIARIDTDV